MAAKKKAGKPKQAKPAAKKSSKSNLKVVRSKKNVAAKKPPKPKQDALPGMEHVRYRDLDAFCEGIAGARKKKNNAIADEQGYIQGAMKAILKHQEQGELKAGVYKYSGVELVLVHGDDKLRVRLIKDSEGEGAPAEGAAEPEAAGQFDGGEQGRDE
jgi:hypothetical protein